MPKIFFTMRSNSVEQTKVDWLLKSLKCSICSVAWCEFPRKKLTWETHKSWDPKEKSWDPKTSLGLFGGGWWLVAAFIFTPIFGEMIQFFSYFSIGLKPPTSSIWRIQVFAPITYDLVSFCSQPNNFKSLFWRLLKSGRHWLKGKPSYICAGRISHQEQTQAPGDALSINT